MRTYYITLSFRGMPAYSCYQTASDEASAVWMATKEAQGNGWADAPSKHTVRLA